MSRKLLEYKEKVLPALKEEFGYTNDLAVPVLEKIVINRGLSAEDSKTGSILENSIEDISIIAGQKAVPKKSTKSIANFKLREGMIVGVMTTLRKERMYSFFDRFVSLACPRIRDFRGFQIKGDGTGNFTVGIDDQRIFPEAEERQGKGFNITFVTSAKSDSEGKALLKSLGFPFRK